MRVSYAKSQQLIHITMCFYQDRREDTLLKLAHFRRHKRKTLKRLSGKSTSYPFHKPEEHTPPGKDSSKKIPKMIGKAAHYAGSAKSKKVEFRVQKQNLHMNNGIGCLKGGMLLQAVQYIPTITNYTQLWWVPNVVVAHQKEGIEAIHLASGRTLCKVGLLAIS